jgi:hypothetical protein
MLKKFNVVIEVTIPGGMVYSDQMFFTYLLWG